MFAEIGQVALAAALFVSIFQGVFPLLGAHGGDARLKAASATAARLQFMAVSVAFAMLAAAHIASDFSVLNVFENSHTAKPFVYKVSGVWGNHEGSMLLWSLILAAFGAALSFRPHSDLTARTLGVQGLLAVLFLAFIIFTSNPFVRIAPVPANGQDLNPLLQDPGLALHPPFLYLGYVGFSIVFSFAVAGLLAGRIDRDWARSVRPWALASWSFLTIGIALGAWWAYYELGWGGFWAWDPVENASFMPWLVGTALIHSLRVTQARGAFKAWSALLAILAFSFSLAGTFLVRSGILTSVHAFAVDPARGVFILAILAIVVGGSLTLFAARGPALRPEGGFAPISREAGIGANNVILLSSCAVVFIGTFYPLFVDVISGEKLSVGAPYFNAVFTPFVLALLAVIGPAAALPWRRGAVGVLARRLAPAGFAALGAMALAAWLASPKTIASILCVSLAVWAGGATIADFAAKARFREPGASGRVARLPPSARAMTLAHIGLAVLTIGVVGAGAWKSETLVYAEPGDVLNVGGTHVRFDGVSAGSGPNFRAESATFAVLDEDRVERIVVAERRFYPVRGMQTTEAGIWTRLSGDLYMTIGDEVEGRGRVVRAWRYPLTIWMWIGAALMAFGGLVGVVTARKDAPRPENAAPMVAQAAE